MSDFKSTEASDTETFYEANQYREFHNNQIQVAKHIIHLFEETGKQYILLQAQMQSGKTGASLFTMFEMIRKYKVKGYVLCGMSDVDLKTQWKDKINIHKDDYTDFIDDIEERRNIRELIKKFEENVHFNNDLKKIKNIEDLRNSLLIIDEIHYGAKEYSQLSNVFKTIGIENILKGEYCSKLAEYNIKIISVSATRAVEDAIYNDSKNKQVKEVWGRVYMEPGDNYKGVIDYYNSEQIKPSIDFNEENRIQIIKLLKSYKSQKKYMIIRATCKKATFIESILNELNIPIIRYDQTSTDAFDSVEPTEFKVCLIKGKLRLGKELDKTHICSVYESSDDTMNDDTLYQGLLGRVCGYNITQDVDIYIPRTPEQITDLVQIFDSVNRDEAIAGISNTTFVPKRHANKIDPEHTPNVHIPSDDEEEDKSSKYYTIPQIIDLSNISDEDFEFFDITDNLQIKSYIPNLLSNLDYTQYSEEQKKEIDILKDSKDNITIRDSHKMKNYEPTNLQYIDKWESLENCILEKKQFKLFDSEPIVAIRILKNIPNTSFKKHTLVIIFKLNSKNKIIEQPFMKIKPGEMHTPKNDGIIISETHTTIEDFTSTRCKQFENSKNLLKEIESKINHFTSEPDNEKKLIFRHTNDKNYDINKQNDTKKFIGIKSNIKKKELEKAIKEINIPNITILKVEVKGKNDKNLRETTGMYIYKQIEIILQKKNN